MYIFGGNNGSSYLNDLWKYDFTNDSWTSLGTGSIGRNNHSSVFYNNSMYIFGGTNGSALNDLWGYDFTNNSWTQLTSGSSIRYGHSAVVYNNAMYIFGGNTGSIRLNDLWKIEMLPVEVASLNSTGDIIDIKFDANGDYLLASTDNSGEPMKIWNTSDWSEVVSYGDIPTNNTLLPSNRFEILPKR